MIKTHVYALFFCALFALGRIAASAQDVENRHFMADISIGTNTDGYEMDFGFTWWAVPNFGFRLAFGLSGELEEIGSLVWYDDDEDYYYYDDDYDYASRFKFMPSLVMRSPTLLNWERQSTTFHLFANPGVCLSPGARGSRNADWFYWQLRGGIGAEIGSELIISLGYGYSNFNLYSGDPWSHNGGKEGHSRHIHSCFVVFGYKF